MFFHVAISLYFDVRLKNYMSQKNSSKHMLSIKIFHQITLVFNGMKHDDFGFGFTNNYGFEDGKVCQA